MAEHTFSGVKPMEEAADGTLFVKNIMVPVRDGTKLAIDINVPAGDGPWPVLLTYTPYRKDDQAPLSGMQNHWARHGYVGARLDSRGTGSSEGINDDEYRPIEHQDGYDAVEWIASQDWCDGKVGMTGGSYGGVTCLQVGALAPPHLVAIAPWHFTDDRYSDECHYRGGALRCYYDIGAYGCSMIGMNAMPPYPEYSGGQWAELWHGQLENNEPYLLKWMAHQTDGEHWRSTDVRGRHDRIKAPALLIGGLRDAYCNGPFRVSERLTAPNKVVLGPWNHTGPDCETPGPSMANEHTILRWFDYWIKGIENGVTDEPKINVYVQAFDRPDTDRARTTGYWRTEEEFPVPGTETNQLHLARELVLDNAELSRGDYEEYEYRPSVGIASGLWSAGVPFGLPGDQRADEIHSVNYTSDPLEEPMEIIGRPRAVLHVSSTAPVMAFVARLSDVAPDGTSAQVTIGVLNGTRRDSLTDPEPMVPGEVYELGVTLDTTAWRFQRGHRIRLSISSADFPNLWPTPYNGSNRIYRSPDRPSRLELPLVPMREAPGGSLPPDEMEYEPSANPRRYPVPPPDVVPWEVRHDMLRDRTGLNLRMAMVNRAARDVTVSLESTLEVWADNRDPANTTAIGKHLRTITRSDGVINVDTSATFRSTENAFHVAIDLDIRVNGLPHHQRRWVETFERVLL